MMEQRLPQIWRTLARWCGQPAPDLALVPEYQRSTLPDSPMNLLLRFETPSGPRSILAAGIPLKIASEITTTMIRTGQFAEFVDHCPTSSVADRVKRRKLEKAKGGKPGNVLGWDSPLGLKTRPQAEPRETRHA